MSALIRLGLWSVVTCGLIALTLTLVARVMATDPPRLLLPASIGVELPPSPLDLLPDDGGIWRIPELPWSIELLELSARGTHPVREFSPPEIESEIEAALLDLARQAAPGQVDSEGRTRYAYAMGETQLELYTRLVDGLERLVAGHLSAPTQSNGLVELRLTPAITARPDRIATLLPELPGASEVAARLRRDGQCVAQLLLATGTEPALLDEIRASGMSVRPESAASTAWILTGSGRTVRVVFKPGAEGEQWVLASRLDS